VPSTAKPVKKQGEKKDRRETIDALRRDQKRAERRKTLLFVGVAGVLGLGLVAAAAVPAVIDAVNDPARKSLSTFGVSASAASCDPVEEVEVEGEAEHVQPGTPVEYDSAPPVSGKHYDTPAPFSRKFYTTDDVPPVEQLVHNLEHGYAVVWYDSTVEGEDLAALEDISARGPEEDATGGKFIVAPWSTDRGEMPEGKHVAITRWGKEQGWKQYCGGVSGEQIQEFISERPYTDSPEPNAI
jgi:hypothetical protein